MKKSKLSFEAVKQLHQQGQLTEAKKGYGALLTRDPKDVLALHYLGLLCAEEGNLEEAQDYLEKALALKKDEPSIHLHLTNILKARGLFSQAAQGLKDLIQSHPTFAAAFNNLGTVYYAQAKLQEAVDAYQHAINLQPNYADAYYNLALALSKLNKIEASINTYQALLELSPDHPGARFQLGCLFMQRSNYQAAIEQFTQIEKNHPYHFETQSNLATCFLKLGQLEQAKHHYVQALELNPKDVQILFNLGVLAMQQGLLDEAIHYYLRTTSEDPDHFDAHNNLAFAYLTLQKNEESLKHFREALRLQPNNESIRHTIHILTGEKHIKTSPLAYVRSLFDSYADHFDQHLTQTLQYQVPQTLYQHLQKIAGKPRAAWDLLDLGCGTGLCGVLFRPYAKTLVGVDISEKMLRIAADKQIYTELVQSDLIPFLREHLNAYDLMIAGDVLVYYGDLAELMTAVFGSLRDQGLFIFNTEINDKEEYRMTASGRFAHNKDYLDRLVAANRFTILQYQVILLRTQNQQQVYGHMYVLKKGSKPS